MKKFFVMALCAGGLLVFPGRALEAQGAAAAARSWYVSAKGSDDNNGRSPEAAFKSLAAAFKSAAASNVKTITVIGTIWDYGYATDTGAAEILLTGPEVDMALVKALEDYEAAVKNQAGARREYEQKLRDYTRTANEADDLIQRTTATLNRARQRLADAEPPLAKAEEEKAAILGRASPQIRELRDRLAAEKAKIAQTEEAARQKVAEEKNQKKRDKAESDAAQKTAKALSALAPRENQLKALEAEAAKMAEGELRRVDHRIEIAAKDVAAAKAAVEEAAAQDAKSRAAKEALTAPTAPPAPARPDAPEGYGPATIQVMNFSGACKVRIENLRIRGGTNWQTGEHSGGKITAVGAAFSLELGKNVNCGELYVPGDGTVTVGANAELQEAKVHGSVVFTMKDNAVIRNSSLRGLDVMGAGPVVTLRDNAQITGCKLYGIDWTAKGGTLTLMNKASVTNCKNIGIRIAGPSDYYGHTELNKKEGPVVTIQDEASVTGNQAETDSSKRGGQGGGIYLSGNASLTLKGKSRISDNKAAKQGGGLYIEGPDGGHGTIFLNNPANAAAITVPFVIIQDHAQITGNEAKEGGGVYVSGAAIYQTMTYKTTPSPQYGARLVKGSLNVQAPVIKGVVEMQGGAITGNKADYGAGIYAAPVKEDFLIVDTASVEYKNEAAKFATFNWEFEHEGSPPNRLPKTKKVSGPAFVLAGGSVTGNAAQFIGGGIYVKGGASVFSQGKGTLSGNSAGDGEGVDIHQQP